MFGLKRRRRRTCMRTTNRTLSDLRRECRGPRLPRTSADERNTRNVSNNGGNVTGNTIPIPSRNSQRNREQYLFNVFEVIVSTLESKLQRIENLDKAVEHLMRRVEALDSRVNDNIDKTDAVITKLRTLDLKLFNSHQIEFSSTESVYSTKRSDDENDSEIRSGSKLQAIHQKRENPSSSDFTLGEKLLSLDQKVSDIDNKLIDLKHQLDNNLLQNDDINAEASEKKPVSMSVIEITKAMSNEVINHITIEIENLRQATNNMDRKLQFHVNLVSDRLGTIYNMMSDVHDAILVRGSTNGRPAFNVTTTTTTTEPPSPRQSKIDRLVEQIYPMLTVSEKMDEVWNVVVGTKSSVDDLLPKSDELLTQTQRQERAISEIHADLRSKTNKIIENLEGVENRLRKQEDDVASLAQRPIPAELLLDPTIDRLVEYDSNRYVGLSDDIAVETTVSPVNPTTIVSSVSMSMSSSTSSNAVSINNFINSSNIAGSTNFSNSTASPSIGPPLSPSSQRSSSKNRGVIFPSVKNKPSPANSTFTTDAFLNYKDVKGYSCVDLLNAGMRDSGVYYLQIRGTTYWFLKVYCEQDIAEGGWTVIQRRDDFGEPRENFNRDWADYKNGFGDPAREFWLGNENIYMLTNNEDYMLRVELEDFEGNKRYAQYSHFKIYSEGEYYKLEIDGYDGNAGDSLNDPWYGSNNSPFSTYNRDNDRSSLNCASMLKGGWWWKSCGRGLNGLYLNDPQDLTARQGIVWFRWRGWDYTLKRATMMIKPKGPTTAMI
ncbi:angiopoietin-4 isoform X1 [Bombus pascuorum]|uniref:angiopoietin-4 isoform X1 n=2 Tax=Bombus pascuorum TaxID=65598 RepID=UPI00298D999B|nr:angiopoietin-4 isoform X1 [Bombus pascuorum]XP_060825519.1 angiopoietin-4 isoform X1 [Bombus pascuorum]XP_060825530.1 angiopoietin-4 isoform X1 [Bombus pascuorum]